MHLMLKCTYKLAPKKLHAHPPTLARKATSKQAGKIDSEPDLAELR